MPGGFVSSIPFSSKRIAEFSAILSFSSTISYMFKTLLNSMAAGAFSLQKGIIVVGDFCMGGSPPLGPMGLQGGISRVCDGSV